MEALRSPDEMYEELRAELLKRLPINEVRVVDKAYEYAKERHRGQLRAEGTPYITHPIEVAKILNEFKVDYQTLAAGLLHDVLEDTPTTLDELKEEFGEEIARLVFGVTKITSISKLAERSIAEPKLTREEVQLRNLRRLLLITVEDVRALVLKLADRLHNIRTIGALPPEKRKRKALETLKIFVPLADRLGMWLVKSELEDLSFKHAHPQEYELIVNLMRERLADVTPLLDEFKESLLSAMRDSGVKGDVSYRVKSAYSIFEKMQRKKLSFDEIYDLVAFRAVVETIAQCYALLGVIHQRWMPIPNRIKDYIAKPKPNGYRSLHTTIIFNSKPIEVQIRTYEMHREAEWGIASHWMYKHGDEELDRILKRYSQRLSSLIETIDEALKGAPPEELEMELKRSVFVFTPKGDCIELPRGSTPIDLAYRIHTEIGNRCTGARVNGKLVPLSYELQNGDIVEIITSKNAKPSIDWLSIVKTSLARSKIKSYFKKVNKELYLRRARELVEKELKGLEIQLNISADELLRSIYERFYRKAYTKLEDFLIAIGFGEIHPQALTDKLKSIVGVEREREQSPQRYQPQSFSPKGMLFRLAKCCSPVKGDEIVGLITRGSGISVHRKSCKNLRALLRSKPELKERLVELSWDELQLSTVVTKLKVVALDRKGLLRDIMEVISGEGINVVSVRGHAKNGEAHITLTIEISSSQQLDRIINLLRREIPEVRLALRR